MADGHRCVARVWGRGLGGQEMNTSMKGATTLTTPGGHLEWKNQENPTDGFRLFRLGVSTVYQRFKALYVFLPSHQESHRAQVLTVWNDNMGLTIPVPAPLEL